MCESLPHSFLENAFFFIYVFQKDYNNSIFLKMKYSDKTVKPAILAWVKYVIY